MSGDLQREQDLARRSLDRRTLGRLFGLLAEQRSAVFMVMALQALAVSTIIARPWFLGEIIDNGLVSDGRGGLSWDIAHTLAMAIGLAALWGARFAFLIQARVRAVDVVVNLLARLRCRLYAHVQSLSVRYFDQTRAGRIVARVDRDVEQLQPLYLEGIPQLLGVVLRCLGGAVMLALILPNALLGLLLLAPLLLGAMFAFRSLGIRLWGGVSEANGAITAHLVETINGVGLIQQSVAEERNAQRYEALLTQLDRAALRAAWGWGWFLPFIFSLFTLGIGVVVITGGIALAEGSITPGRLTECIFYVFLFLGPLMELGDLFERASSGAAAGQRIFLVLDTEPEIQDQPLARDCPMPSMGALAIDRVWFRYNEGGPWVLRDVSLDIPSGSTIAIVGATGHGKSTLVQLLARFYDPQQGHIRLDGQDIRHLRQHSLRRQVSLVLQDNVLFSGTVMANLRLAHQGLTDHQIMAAAHDLGVAEIIERLPHGWYSEVGARGDHMSHGQRQVICLLRAWLADPAVLILDEATSAIDVRSERIIQRALKRLMRQRTAVVVAHRLATVRDADRIVVIDEGRIVEDGPHQELIEQGGAYARLHQRLLRSEQI